MKKTGFGILLAILVALSACGPAGTATPGASPTSSALTPRVAGNAVMADAVVVPVRRAALAFQAGGPLAALEVQEGQGVKAGTMLARLDDTDARLAVGQAQAALVLAQAQLAKVKAASPPAKVTGAEQALKEAEAVAWRASARLAQARAGVTAADLAAAEAALAQAALAQKVAQDTYDQAPKDKQSVAADALAVARQAYSAAQQRLAQLRAGATTAELDAARAGVAAAQAQKAMAQAQLDVLKAGATREQIAVAEAGVRAAQVAVETAQAQQSKLQLVAPFDGVIASLDLRPGQFVAPGVPVAWLADTSAWQIETDDLTEINVVRVRVGDPATITFDALPDLELTGKVVRIEAFGKNKQGDITYTVVVQPDQQNDRLRWNMTASVTIGAQ